MYKGTKFNTRMEDVKGEAYLGIKIFRFYYRCTNCSAEFCMKTDPKTADYIVEGGASRNYEPWRDKEQSAADAVAQKEEEEKGNAMKALENRTLDSKREMDILTALDEMRSLKARHETVDTETALAALRRAAAKEEEEEKPVDLDAEDEEAVRQMLLQRAGFVKRIESSSGEEDGDAEGGGGVEENRERLGGASGSRIAKKSRKDGTGTGRGAPLSVAAAAWEEDEEEDEGEDGGGAEEEEDEGKKNATVGAGGNTSAHDSQLNYSKSNVVALGGAARKNRSIHGAMPASVDGAAAPGKSAPAAADTTVPWAGLLPPSVPSFSARPAAVVVKRKNSVPVVVQKRSKEKGKEQQQKQEENNNDSGSGDGDGGTALRGLLGGYGSSDSE
jgi:Saf4/Yju2 protein